MRKLRIVGALWIAVAVMSIAATVMFRVDSSQIVATIGLGAATVVLGSWMLALPSRLAIPTSIAAGIVWLVVYLGLAVLQSEEPAAWVTDAFLAFAASSPAFLAWTAGRNSTVASQQARRADEGPTAGQAALKAQFAAQAPGPARDHQPEEQDPAGPGPAGPR